MLRRSAVVVAIVGAALPACGSCSKNEPSVTVPDAAAPSAVIAEALPRCRAGKERLPIPGEDVIVGDVAVGPEGLLVGLIRTEPGMAPGEKGGKRVASVMRASLDLATSKVVDVGPALGDDPPPSPRWNGATALVAVIGPMPSDAGPRVRALRVFELGEGGVVPERAFAPVLQQFDESTAFDVAFGEDGAALAAWDEDAPFKDTADASVPGLTARGFVKVQPLVRGATAEAPPRRVASPETSDADSPRLVPRAGGFWLGWLARRLENDQHYVEGPGEKRAFRWVEVVALDAKGQPAGPVRRVSPENGRAATFELARSGPDLVVMVQDEAAPSEGAGARIVRYRVPAASEKAEAIESADVVDGGVGQTIVELVPVPSAGETSRWLAWSDTAERAQMTPLDRDLVAAGRTSPEPSLDGARVLAHAPPDGIYALVGPDTGKPEAPTRPELRRFVCH